MMSVRFTVLKPASVNATWYVPGLRSTILYWPAVSVTTVRVFSINTGLDASTVTPGRTAPVPSFTTPAIATCALAMAGTRHTAAPSSAVHKPTRRMTSPLFGPLPHEGVAALDLTGGLGRCQVEKLPTVRSVRSRGAPSGRAPGPARPRARPSRHP